MLKISLKHFVFSALVTITLGAGAGVAQKNEIIHDGEYFFLEQQHGKHWAAEDMEIDDRLGEIFDEIDRLGIAGNTLIVLMADNGLMYHYEGTSGLNQLIYRGGKTQHLEGGVRVDAFARWPGVIDAGSAAGDIIHVTDLFTTFARLAQAKDYIPRDRVIDGIDQTALLLKGEHHGRRDYVYIYENELLRSIVKQEFTMHMPLPGIPGAAAPTFNLYRDPREEHPQVGIALWTTGSARTRPTWPRLWRASAAKRLGKCTCSPANAGSGKQKYPDEPNAKGGPYDGIENLRPESKAAVEAFLFKQGATGR